MTARIAPGDRSEAGVFAWGFSRVAGLVTRTAPPALFLTMGRQHKLFRGWLRFAGRLMPGGSLPRRDTELIILRVAHLRGCAYEFEHHRHMGKRAGVTVDDLERIQRDGLDGWAGREHALLTAVDALIRDRDLDDVTWKALREHLDESHAIEFLLLVGHYDMLATFLGTLRIEPDRHR
jgi:AhpD family alkylhydroperoxidase